MACARVPHLLIMRSNDRNTVVTQALRLPGRNGGKRSAGPAIIAACLALPLSSMLGAADKKPASPGREQVPGWSEEDLKFFLHGSMGTEVVPEAVLRAF